MYCASATTRGEQRRHLRGWRPGKSSPISHSKEGVHRAQRGTVRRDHDAIEPRPVRRNLVAGLTRPERILMDEGATQRPAPHQLDMVDQTRADHLFAGYRDVARQWAARHGQSRLGKSPCRPQQERDHGRCQQQRPRPAAERARDPVAVVARSTSWHFPTHTPLSQAYPTPTLNTTLTKGEKCCNVTQQRVQSGIRTAR